MMLLGAGFVWFALRHPELSWPGWFPCRGFYGTWLLVQTVLMIAPSRKKKA